MPNNPMPDLLGRIAAEIDERLRSLAPAVQEFERLRADLRALQGEMEVPDEAIPIADVAPVAETTAPIPGVTAVAVAEIAPVAEATAPIRGVTAVVEVAGPIGERIPGAESASPPTLPCEAPRPRPLLSPKVLRLMDSPGRGPLRARGVGRARRPAAPVADRLGVGGGASGDA